MVYMINIEYEDGDTNGRSDRNLTLPFKWTDKFVAKEALKRIREHYEWWRCDKDYCFHAKGKCAPKPEWVKRLPKQKWGMDTDVLIPLDNDTEEPYYADWCGYFARLQGGTIVTMPEEGTSFRIS